MKTRLVLGGVVLVGLVALAVLLLQDARRNGSVVVEPVAENPSGGGQELPVDPAAGGTVAAVEAPPPPNKGAPAQSGSASAGQASPDSGPARELAEPSQPPDTEKLGREALVRQRDMVRAELSGLQERIPKLKAVLEELRRSGSAQPLQLQQIQRQLQQAVDAVSRLERQLPTLEAKVTEIKGAGPERPVGSEAKRVPPSSP